MSQKEMRPLTISVGASALLPSFSLVTATSAGGGRDYRDCFGRSCNPWTEYCSDFTESCASCAEICDAQSHNHQADVCTKQCSEYNKFESLKVEIHSLQSTQRLILVVLSVLVVLIAIRYLWLCICWLRDKRCFAAILKKLQPKQDVPVNANGKDLNAITIQNLNAISRDIERAPSQIYSVTGPAEGTVMTMTTPVSTRYPAENSTTPETVVTEYSYDNEAMVVTPVSEKPSSVTKPAF